MNSDTRAPLSGAMTALVTPMRGGHVDDDALRRLVRTQLDAGIDGLCPCGTTGETPTLETEEQAHVIRLVVETVKAHGNPVPVIAGVGANSTAHTIANARAAEQAGADALLVVTPYYNKPTQEGLYRHFRALADAVPLPIVIYNIPGRTGCDMSTETLARIVSAEPRIVALKEATGSIARAQEVVSRLGDRISVLSGDDALNLAVYAVGGRGCISVVSNIAPKLVADTWDAASAGDFVRARALHFDMLPLCEALFVETNPIPVKAALAMMGVITPEIRPPLYPLAGPTRERLRAILSEHGLV